MRAIDLFAGLGGFSEGARLAGVRVAWAANHWQAAVDTHARNHPETAHSCQDLHQANWTSVPAHDVLLASPACQGHSRARGVDRPHHDAFRSTAWAVVSCAEVHRPAFCVVENVPEFLAWSLYPSWSDAMRRLGYSLAPHIVDAADHGVPQHRRRVFVICARSRASLRLTLPRRQHVPASSILDGEGQWSAIDAKCANTRARVATGRSQHGARFLVAYYGNEKGGRSLARPIGTLTTRDRWAIVDGDRMRMLNIAECRRGMGFPDAYALPPQSKLAKHMLGNAVCPPVARDIIEAIKAAG
jgi:DNA (cytosine-5)-methyltransferase 1